MIFTTIYHSARFYCIVVTIEFYDFHFSLNKSPWQRMMHARGNDPVIMWSIYCRNITKKSL